MSTTTRHLSIPADLHAERFGRRAFTIGHDLADDPRTSLESLAELADALPPEAVEHNVGRLPEVVVGGEVPKAALTPGEIVRGIETNDCWIVLPLHVLPEGVMEPYRELFRELSAELRAHLRRPEDEVRAEQAVFFLATGGSTTPAHIDPEQGFLMQIRGTKEVRIGAFDTEARRRAEVERFAMGGHRNVGELPASAETIVLEPGMGVHVPAYVPHVIHNGPATSLALSIGARTRGVMAETNVGWWNGQLRRAGASPSRRPRAERLKAGSLDLARTVLRRG